MKPLENESGGEGVSVSLWVMDGGVMSLLSLGLDEVLVFLGCEFLSRPMARMALRAPAKERGMVLGSGL